MSPETKLKRLIRTIWSNSKEELLYNESFKKTSSLSDGLAKRNRFYALTQLIETVMKNEIKGDIVECGCWKGQSSYIISKILAQYNFNGTFHIFDSFEGLSEIKQNDTPLEGYFQDEDTNFECSEKYIIDYTLQDFNFIQTHKGWIPNKFHKVNDTTFSFVHIDVDLYEPTKQSINFFWDKLNIGGIMIFDDYNSVHYSGATKAVNEFLATKPKHQLFFKLPIGSAYIIK